MLIAQLDKAVEGTATGEKGTTKKLASRTKSKGKEIEVTSPERELDELRLSGAGGYGTVDEEVILQS